MYPLDNTEALKCITTLRVTEEHFMTLHIKKEEKKLLEKRISQNCIFLSITYFDTLPSLHRNVFIQPLILSSLPGYLPITNMLTKLSVISSHSQHHALIELLDSYVLV